MGARAICGGGFLALLACAAVTAPWLGLRDPAAQPDGLVLRDLPPLSRVHAITLAGGEVRYAHEVRPLSDGSVEYLRGESWSRIPVESLAGPDPGQWHRRPWFLLGTDGFGRDLLSRLVHGARVSLAIGLIAGALAVVGGAAVGLASGLAGGWVDALLMRFTDLVLAVPRLFLALMLVALYGVSLTTTVLVLAGTTWMVAARLVRGEVLSARERDYVQAARATGVSTLRLGLVHLLPAALSPLMVEGALRVGDTILLEAALSFLGLGVPPPTPSWGNLIADGRSSLLSAWWIATLPGLAIVATVVALTLVGDSARDRLLGRSSHSRLGRPRAERSARGGSGAPRKLVPVAGSLFCLLVAALATGVAAGSEQPVRLAVERDDDGARFVVANSAVYPVNVTVSLTEQWNLTADREATTTTTVPASSEQVVLTLAREDATNPWSYRYRWSWSEAPRVVAAPDETHVYALPYPPGFDVQFAEVLDADPSHQTAHALDFLAPAGTPVQASRDGTVSRVARDGEGLVQIEHADGTIGSYLRLDRIRVRPGDPVVAGDPLAVVREGSGASASHLHFHVARGGEAGAKQIVPVRFEDREVEEIRLDPF